MNAKICDFGLSKHIKSTNVISLHDNIYGTVTHAAPEYLDYRRIAERNEKGDIFSFGVVLWELVTRKKPWEAEIAMENFLSLDIVQKVLAGARLEIPTYCHSELRNIMLDCWKGKNDRK